MWGRSLLQHTALTPRAYFKCVVFVCACFTVCKEAFGEDNLLESYVFFCHVLIDINTEFSATSAKDITLTHLSAQRHLRYLLLGIIPAFATTPNLRLNQKTFLRGYEVRIHKMIFIII